MIHPRHRSGAARQQRGVVLVIALIMLIVIGLASVAVMRNVMNTDLVSENNRRQSQAMQAAQTALRYCETQLEAGQNPQAASTSQSEESWRAFSKWQEDGTSLSQGKPIRVPAASLNSSNHQTSRYADSGPTAKLRPQCMAQSRDTGSGTPIIVVTARGFSDDYSAANNGITTSGAVVWLQSIVQLAARDEG